MKRTVSLLSALLMLFAFASCTVNNKATESDGATSADSEATTELVTKSSLSIRPEEVTNAAIVYFSHNDVIKEVAEFAAELRNCALIEIVPKKEYPDDEAELQERIREEKEKNVRPALKNQPEDLNDYDIIFIGFPIWENTMPMAVYTFIEDYDMVDKAIIPFCYNPDNTFGESLNDIASICRYGAIVSCYTITDSDFENQKPIFEGWMNEVLFS